MGAAVEAWAEGLERGVAGRERVAQPCTVTGRQAVERRVPASCPFTNTARGASSPSGRASG
ncbi:MAG: hypothetical protein U0599_15215 [Vicinamibacteria bacterium]